MNRKDLTNSNAFRRFAAERQGGPGVPLAMMLLTLLMLSVQAAIAAEEVGRGPVEDNIWVYHLTPEARGGRAYKLVYVVPVPIDIYWGFKTDFDNDFLTRNKYIAEHRFIFRNANSVVTGNRYTSGPDGLYRWQTTVMAERRRLEYVLLNPAEMKQKFHYGCIQLAAVNEGTLVTQVAYFDFFGVSLWAAYPWAGGMKDFLVYTARWEQDMVVALKDRYSTAGHLP